MESCKFRSSEDMDLRASLCHQAFGLGQSRAWAWESGLISLFHRALASSDLLSFSVPGVPAMAASFHAPRRLSWLQQHGAQGAWGRGTAPKGISGAGVAKKAAMSVCKYSPGRGTQPSASTSLFSSSTSYAFALGTDQFRIPSGGTGWFRAHGRWVVRGIAVKTQEGREWEEGGPWSEVF